MINLLNSVYKHFEPQKGETLKIEVKEKVTVISLEKSEKK